jgi:hypothetical protein
MQSDLGSSKYKIRSYMLVKKLPSSANLLIYLGSMIVCNFYASVTIKIPYVWIEIFKHILGYSFSVQHYRIVIGLLLPVQIPSHASRIQHVQSTLNVAYTVGSSILWVHTFVYYIFIHFNIFSSILTNFIYCPFIFHPIYLYYIMSRK